MRIARGISVTNTSKPISTAIAYDADATAFFTAASITDTTQKNAVNTLVLSLKSANIWTKMKALYPVVGGSASSHAVNLKQPGTYNLTFATGWTHSNTGMTPNGAAYADTGLIPSSVLSINSASLGYYGGNNTGQSFDKTAIGCALAGRLFAIEPSYTGFGLFADINDGSTTYTVNTNTSGFIFASRLTSTQKIISLRGSQNTKTENSIGIPTCSVVIGARNVNNTIGNYSTIQHRFDFIANGLTNVESTDLHNAVQTYQTSLGRQV
jgi:hypothetical protein